MNIDDAIEVFGRGFCFTRSFTYPYVLERHGPLWVMRDAPRKRPEYRNEEWLMYGVSAAEAEKIVQANRRDRYTICAIRTPDQPHDELRESFKALGYRLGHSETFFAHPLDKIEPVASDFKVDQVLDVELANKLAKAARSRQIFPKHLEENPPRIRQYVASDGDELVGWVRSIVCGEYGWCSNMYVRDAYRRKGIGKALMTRMLQDDKAAGLRADILLASHAGSMLYPLVGYKEIGYLSVFTPKR